jgi:hypothetical protein
VPHPLTSATRWLAAAAGVAAGAYATYVAVTWCRYGTPSDPADAERDDLLDRFLPVYDVVERHHIAIAAPAAVTLAAAVDMKLNDVPAIRAIFKGREWILGASGSATAPPRGIVEETLALGWRVLADVPGHKIVVGAVTRPWEADVTFRPIAPAQFAAFDEPDYVKIVWTLRADPLGATESMFRTETRALATSLYARRRFRRYWALLSPGILLIRQLSLAPLKADAERRAAAHAGDERARG